MKISKIDNVLKDTQNILNYPQKVVDDVVLHVFESLADYVKYPTKAGFRIQHWGVFRPNATLIKAHLKYLVRKLREDRNNEDLKKQFRAYWKVRHLKKEDDERRNYKKRFGSWHYK